MQEWPVAGTRSQEQERAFVEIDTVSPWCRVPWAASLRWSFPASLADAANGVRLAWTQDGGSAAEEEAAIKAAAREAAQRKLEAAMAAAAAARHPTAAELRAEQAR